MCSRQASCTWRVFSKISWGSGLHEVMKISLTSALNWWSCLRCSAASIFLVSRNFMLLSQEKNLQIHMALMSRPLADPTVLLMAWKIDHCLITVWFVMSWWKKHRGDLHVEVTKLFVQYVKNDDQILTLWFFWFFDLLTSHSIRLSSRNLVSASMCCFWARKAIFGTCISHLWALPIRAQAQLRQALQS